MAKSRTIQPSAPPAQPAAVAPAPIPSEGDKPVVPGELPILPLREIVVFPGTVTPLSVGRAASLKLLEESLPGSKIIGLVTQRDPEVENPAAKDIYSVGTAVVVLKLIRQNEGSTMLLVHGVSRFRLGEITQSTPFMKAKIETVAGTIVPDKNTEAAFKHLRRTALELVTLSPQLPEQIQQVINSIEEPGHLADFLASNVEAGIAEKQDLLEELDVGKRMRAVQLILSRQTEMARLQQKIHQDVQSTITESQRKAYLREQMRAIQKELGEAEGENGEQVAELRKRLAAAKPPEAVMKEAERELKRLGTIHPASPEYSVILTYLETIADLPWNKLSEDKLDLKEAQRILDRDHYDLQKVKRRLIEYLAVRKLNPQGRGPILCFLGPPGVGKTSLGQSIADALGRRFVRVSLGGIRDEAEIRGHRRTYIGAMPGRMIQEMRRAGTRNPVMMLDEIDKLGADFRGDPGSALLEVLDPRQNSTFVDRYLDVPFDLSQVIFIATANYMDPVPPALRDRMEIIDIPGYTDADKLQICKRYLVPRQLKENGLKREQVKFPDEALTHIIEHYTREAGVRDLERQVGAVVRGIAADVARGKRRGLVKIDRKLVSGLLGPEHFVRELANRVSLPGVVTGLAYTPYGGEVLFIEAARFQGKGHISLTGQIGDVMRESARAAWSLVKSRAVKLGIDAKEFHDFDVHLHVPAGAVPKDGPSAGVAMYTALASLFLNRPARSDVAMTGEITLRGLVLPIGGLKEKSLAAARLGIRHVIAPKGNAKDLPDVSDEVKKRVKFHFIENVDQLLELALLPKGKSRRKR
jgi:ATP-dependent Lon protease